ncbi:hypothetical protein [Saccharopolyspora sp. SCSIO 74807]|uniref:hypothetical protein n=1 Tax=Saccharopolyspora sp. SCSIO 74807 TaxID=3118084 RepID=UPI0030CE06BA
MDGTGGIGRDPLDLLVPDLTGHPPMCGEEELARRMAVEVAKARARAFAVVQEYGTRAAMEIAGWGIAVGGRYDVIGVGGGQWLADALARLRAAGVHLGRPGACARGPSGRNAAVDRLIKTSS